MFLWYGSAGHESAGKLAAWLTMHGVDVQLVAKQEKLPSEALNTFPFGVSWGRKLPVTYTRVLNSNAPIGDKLREMTTLMGMQIPTPGVSLHHHQGWWARKHQHKDGDDLLNQTGQGDFYVQPIPTTYEFRVNVFDGEVFRTGLKEKKPGVEQKYLNGLPIRTGKHGWTWSYKQEPLNATHTNRAPMRELAVKAVKALNYDFGAVDIGYTPDGRWVVFEVNSAPALEESDLGRYGQLILDYGKAKGYIA